MSSVERITLKPSHSWTVRFSFFGMIDGDSIFAAILELVELVPCRDRFP